MNTYGLLLVSGIPVLILGVLLVWSWRRISLLGTLIVGATLAHELILILYPVWYSVFTEFGLESDMYATVRAGDLVRVMTGEAVFVLVFALAFVVGCPRVRQQAVGTDRASGGPRKAARVRLVSSLLIVAGCVVYGRMAVQASTTLRSGSGWTPEQLLVWFETLFSYTSVIACALVLTRRRVLFTNPVQSLMSAIPLLALLMVGFSGGVRGRITLVIALLIITGILNHQARFVALGSAIAILMIPLFALLGGAYRLVNRDNVVTVTERREMLTLLYEEGRSRVVEDLENTWDDFLYALASRAQGPRNSAVLYQQYDAGTRAGFSPYLGSVFFPIPRLLWPEKPWAGGTDDLSTSSATYRVMEWGYGYVNDGGPGATMGPILASAHAYWEGGWGWLVAAGSITGLLWSGIFRLCRRLPEEIAAIVALAVAAALLIDGMLTMLTPLYTIVIAGWQSVLPVLLIYWGTAGYFSTVRLACAAREPLNN